MPGPNHEEVDKTKRKSIPCEVWGSQGVDVGFMGCDAAWTEQIREKSFSETSICTLSHKPEYNNVINRLRSFILYEVSVLLLDYY